MSYPEELIVSVSVTTKAMITERITLVMTLEFMKKDNPKCNIIKLEIKNAPEPKYVLGDFVLENGFFQLLDL